ncbi:MAG: fibronectin type III domain-containing protein [Actinomycetota bacterium]|nr:fibronectin type III domain-containing protein [Actinomycetota bacterium]
MRPLAAASAAGVVVAIVFGAASPASASVPPAITIASPASNAVLTDQPTISGNAAMPGAFDNMGNVAVSLVSGPGNLPSPCDPCGSGSGQSVSFSWSPALAHNGPFQAHIEASGSQFLLGVLDGAATSEATVSFRMEIPPAEPGGVRAEAGPDQSVRVTWARNSEPDMIAYRVQRKDPGASAFHDVGGAVAQPSNGSAVSVADPAAGPGGTFIYQVQAIRAGRSGDASTAVGSGFTATQVVVPPAPPGAPPPPGSPPPAGPAQSPAPTPNLSAFLKGSGAPPKASVPAAPSIPDGTFQENLPFAVPRAGGSGRAGADTIGLHADSSGNSTRAVLVPVAGGLLLCLVAFHVRRFNGWLTAGPGAVKRGPTRRQVSETLPVVATGESVTSPARDAPPDPQPPPEPTPAPTWLTGLIPLASEARPTATPRAKKPAVSLDYWSTSATVAAKPEATTPEATTPEATTPEATSPVEGDADEGDEAKWAPLTVAKHDAWEDILVKPGATTTHHG